MADLAEPQLDHSERAAFERGVAQFNDGHYFECHDTLEDVWAGVRGASRDFFQGLIQVAVGCYHVGNDNAAGAVSMFERALKRFEGYPPRYYGFDLVEQRTCLQLWIERLRRGEAPLTAQGRPEWRFER